MSIRERKRNFKETLYNEDVKSLSSAKTSVCKSKRFQYLGQALLRGRGRALLSDVRKEREKGFQFYKRIRHDQLRPVTSRERERERKGGREGGGEGKSDQYMHILINYLLIISKEKNYFIIDKNLSTHTHALSLT